MIYYMQRCFISLLWPHRTRENTSAVADVDAKQGGDHNPCYTPSKIGMVSGGGDIMENGRGEFIT